MKVLQINAVLGFDSTGIIVSDIGNTLEENGHEAYYAYQRALGAHKNAISVGNKLDKTWHALWTRVTGKQGYASKRSTKKLIKWIREIKPDVVHLHNLHSNFIHFNTLTEYLAKEDIPTVITMHDCWYFTGKCSHYAPYGCDRWQATCGDCPALKSEVKSWFVDATRKVLSDRVSHLNAIPNLTLVGCSNWIAGEAKNSLLKPRRIAVVHNGVDCNIFAPKETDFMQRLGITPGELVVMGTANKWCDPRNEEGALWLVKSNPSVRFVIIGAEGKTCFDGRANVVTLGYISGKDELASAYAGASVFVNLTRADTLPTVNMEAICSGTPVVTFDVGGSPELIQSGDGFIVPEGDFEAIDSCIKELQRAPIKVDVERAKNRFDKRKCYERYLEIYDEARNVGK